jgi:leader peptidase (prepilin peptidase)/N-methyltransferase
MFLFGLCLGSFLNVVIYRLPKMLTREWSGDTDAVVHGHKPFNLVLPSSHCPTCEKKIPFYLNIPLLGYFLARGKCIFCHQKIPITYPLVEFLSAVSVTYIAYKWGVGLETLAAIVFTALLIPLMFIDIKHQMLPDMLTLFGIWLGLSVNLLNLFSSIEDAVIGTIIGYCSLWMIAKIFQLIRKKEGIGYGDFKLFSMLGAWQGWQDLPFILLQASFLGLIVSAFQIFLKKQKFNNPIPFGPYLAISGWVTLFWGEEINQFYQSVFSKLLGWE